MSNEAKVRIGGDAGGATRATDQTRKGLQGVGDEAQKAGQKAKEGAEQAAAGEKKFESQVQLTIQKLKAKETQAKATEEAMKRLGKAETPAGPGAPGVRGVMAMGGPPTVGGGAPGGIAQGLAKVGGGAGAALGALGNAVPALAAVGVAAVGLKLGFEALRASSELAAKTAGDTVRLEQQRNTLIEAATKQLGQSTLSASAEGGGALRQFVARGGSISQAQDIAARTGTNAGQASQIGATVAGLDEQSKKVIMQAVADAVRLGVDPVKTAEALRDSSKGGLGDMDREAALRNAGSLFDSFSGQQLKQSFGNREGDLNRLQDLSGFAGRESRAAFGNLTKDAAVNAAESTTAEAARKTADPITAALSEHSKILKKEIEVLEAMGRAEHPLIRGLNDLTASLRGSGGSYANQAARQRGVNAAAGF